ncbi:MAG: TetR/AcrR family transcriptional regulator [Candidatus Latescibacteria bacterium]|jgi:AcrR family transcriptional regulator|nr:TetR/AcrR family transcriptional regulator [Candidatus Latescibacterota bacterium]
MPTKRFKNVDQDRKNKILDAAREEFILNGYEGASLNNIIRDAEISKGSLYYYFEDKADIYMTVLENAMQEINMKIGGIAAGEFSDDFWNDVESYCKKTIHITFENPEIIKLFRGLYYLSTTLTKPESVAEFYNTTKEFTSEIIKRGQNMGAVRKDIPLELLVNIIFSMGEAMDLWFLGRWNEFTHEEIERVPQIYTELFRRVAGTEPVKGDMKK